MALPRKSLKNGPSRENHTRKAYMGIRSMMFHNDIGPGQKIAYRDLAERLGMSQTPVIQALKWLEFQGLVCHEPNRGYYTAPISIQEVEEIYEFREMVERALLPKAMARMTAGGLRRIETALDAHVRAARDVYLHERLVTDMEFHLALAGLSGNHVQCAALRNLFDLLYLKYGPSILFSTSVERADNEHQQLVARIRENDLDGAESVLSRHIRHIRDHVLSGLRQREAMKAAV